MGNRPATDAVSLPSRSVSQDLLVPASGSQGMAALFSPRDEKAGLDFEVRGPEQLREIPILAAALSPEVLGAYQGHLWDLSPQLLRTFQQILGGVANFARQAVLKRRASLFLLQLREIQKAPEQFLEAERQSILCFPSTICERLHQRLSMLDPEESSRLMKALDPSCLAIVELLAAGEMKFPAFAEKLQVSDNTIYRHIEILWLAMQRAAPSLILTAMRPVQSLGSRKLRALKKLHNELLGISSRDFSEFCRYWDAADRRLLVQLRKTPRTLDSQDPFPPSGIRLDGLSVSFDKLIQDLQDYRNDREGYKIKRALSAHRYLADHLREIARAVPVGSLQRFQGGLDSVAAQALLVLLKKRHLHTYAHIREHFPSSSDSEISTGLFHLLTQLPRLRDRPETYFKDRERGVFWVPPRS